MPHEYAQEPVDDFERQRAKRKAAMKLRLKRLPQDNPIVKAALEQKDEVAQRKEKGEKWEIVENLQFTAYNQYMDEDLDFKKAVIGLSEALKALVS